MDNLTERLLGENFEEALKEFGAEWEYKTVVRELHARLRTAKAEGAAALEDVARMQKSIRKIRCTCHCKVHGPGCGAQEATCRDIVRCDRCKAIDSARAGGDR